MGFNLTHVEFFKFFFKANLMILCQHQFYHLINLEKKFVKFSYVSQKTEKSFANICMPKKCKMSVCLDFVAQNAKKKYTNTKNIQNTHQSLFCNKIGIKIKK